MQLLTQKNILITDGLSEIEISQLEALYPVVSNLRKKLANYSIKETIVQPDFHDNNLLIDMTSQNITIIDLGEIAISHPFFSLINFMDQIKKHHPVFSTAASVKIYSLLFKSFSLAGQSP